MTQNELSKLTPGQKRVKIAEARGARVKRQAMKGYKRGTMGEKWVWKDGAPCAYQGGGFFGWGWNKKASESELPDYLNDLNACHEMEEALTEDQRITYVAQLERLTLNKPVFSSIFATAAQRADAFLLTI